jgi:bifunctional N-acetylglucosamine-1-phosphate-uridyltransferase/glucosamine-1-phosphate-acetyltransferase GlmU-like protein
MKTHAIIMAGGEGKRMQSTTPKVLHKVLGEPMVVRIIKKVLELHVERIYVVCGTAIDEIRDVVNQCFANLHNVHFVKQHIAQGTGDAVKHCIPYLPNEDVNVLILNGDTPLIDKTINMFVECPAPALMVTHLQNPFGNGRIITNNEGAFVKIVEEKDATYMQKQVTLVNCGVYLISSNDIKEYIPLLTPNNAQNEYYLTDICGFLHDKLRLVEIPLNIQHELLNVNSPTDLSLSQRFAIAQHMRKQGMIIRPLEECDGHKGYLKLLSQLSDTMIDKSIKHFQSVYCTIKENKNHHVYVVEDTSLHSIVGSIVVLVEPKFIHNGLGVGHIEDVVVSSTHRARRIGGLMVDYVTTFMNDFNCYKFILDCNEALEGFYVKSGYEKKNIQMALYKR